MNHASVHVIVPDAVDDPTRPSGGNRYDRRVSCSLAAAGWPVHEHKVPDTWPRMGPAGRRATAKLLEALPDGALLLVDGLIASAGAQLFVAAANRLALVVLVHMPLHDDPASRGSEAAVLRAARAIVTTSAWSRDRLLAAHALAPAAVLVAEPGVDDAPVAVGSSAGGELVCVGPISPEKGHDVLVAALTVLADQPWRCRCVGPVDRDPAFVAWLRRTIHTAGLADRLRLAGPLTATGLDATYRSADVLVHPSRAESYGMVVTEALSRGLPVIGTTAGGLPEALGHIPDHTRPGILVPPGDVTALADALRGWLTDADLRCGLRQAALARRDTVPSWKATVQRVAAALTMAMAAGP